MSSLSAAGLRSRLKFDYDVIRGLRSETLGPVRPFISEDALRAGSDAAPEDGAAGRVRLYLVEFRFPILIAADKTTPSVAVKFDLLAGGNYPFSDPVVSCVSRPLPWSPHVRPASGGVCIGEGWHLAGGRMLAAQLLVHIMRILNTDEPDRGPDYGGWNWDAAEYWRRTLHGRPLNPDLAYPLLDAQVTHGVADPASFFRPADVSQIFVPAAPFERVEVAALFHPIQPAIGQFAGGDFRPLGNAA